MSSAVSELMKTNEMADAGDLDATAVATVRLTNKLDGAILALRKLVRPAKPWQRTLISALDEADRQMQVLRMLEAMDKSDQLIAQATIEIAKTCRQVSMAVVGSRADGLVRSSATAIDKSGSALCKLVLDAVSIQR